MIKKLQFLLLATLTTLVADIYGQTDSSELDLAAQVNEIKLDDNFIYGEATTESLEGANALAQDFLKINIEQWVAENNVGEKVSKIDIGEIQQKCQRLELTRGTMFRSFVYVNKSNIAVTKQELTLTIQIDAATDSVAVAEVARDVDTVEVAAPVAAEVAVEAPVADSVEVAAVAVPAEVAAVAAPAEVAAVAAPAPAVEVAAAPAAPVVAAAAVAAPAAVAVATAAPVADTVYIEVPVAAPAPVADTVYIEVPVAAPAPVADTVYIEVPVAAPAPVEVAAVEEEVVIVEEEPITLTPKEAFERDIAAVNNIGEMLELFNKTEYQKCKYGDVNKSSIKDIDINTAYLAIYSPADGEIKSILGLRLDIGVRLNLKTGKVDSTLNHKGSKATWIIFNEN